MAATYAQSFARANAASFQARVRVALAKVAGDAVGEALGVMSAAVHAKRHDHGVIILNSLDRDEYVKRYAYAIVMEPQLTVVDQVLPVTGDEVVDSVLLANVRNAFPRFAGIKVQDAV